MIKTQEVFYCDVCDEIVQEKDFNKQIMLPVLFSTDQTTGEASTPYLDYKKIDVCRKCLKKVLILQGEGTTDNFKVNFKKVSRAKKWEKR